MYLKVLGSPTFFLSFLASFFNNQHEILRFFVIFINFLRKSQTRTKRLISGLGLFIFPKFGQNHRTQV
jgi:hypothetical protein